MGKTIVVVTHRSDFLKLADRIFTIANGEMKEQPILNSQILDQFSEKPS
jgi:ABC-type siderophore export system fused ATPase/permease subunit